MTILIDLTHTPCGCTNHALEELHKSLSDPPDDDIWRPHHDPYIRGAIEEFTATGLAILGNIKSVIEAAINHDTMAKAESPWMRLSAERLTAIQEELAQKEYADYSMEDWLLFCEWAVNSYLPDGKIKTMAEWLAVRSMFAGKVKAALDAQSEGLQIEELMREAPITLVGYGKVVKVSGADAAIIGFARARAGELIGEIKDKIRHRVNRLIVEWHEAKHLAPKHPSLWDLQSKLQDEFALLNRDWRRVALTEAARDANEGMLASIPEGNKVKRMEAYVGACAFCRKIDGMIFNVVSPDKEDKDGWADVWVGKTNIGRSASPRKRVGGELVERTASELWWPAAGVQHPNCRGGWLPLEKGLAEIDPGLDEWLKKRVASA